MFELKPIAKSAVRAALSRAERYRLLNEPLEAESICLDVLEVEPGNQDALVTLLLALTDQLKRRPGEKLQQATEVARKLTDEYSRDYYEGLIAERRAKVSLEVGGPGSGSSAYEWFRKAMEKYELAEKKAPKDNNDAVLRWNTCARILNRNPSVVPRPDDPRQPFLE